MRHVGVCARHVTQVRPRPLVLRRCGAEQGTLPVSHGAPPCDLAAAAPLQTALARDPSRPCPPRTRPCGAGTPTSGSQRSCARAGRPQQSCGAVRDRAALRRRTHLSASASGAVRAREERRCLEEHAAHRTSRGPLGSQRCSTRSDGFRYPWVIEQHVGGHAMRHAASGVKPASGDACHGPTGRLQVAAVWHPGIPPDVSPSPRVSFRIYREPTEPEEAQ